MSGHISQRTASELGLEQISFGLSEPFYESIGKSASSRIYDAVFAGVYVKLSGANPVAKFNRNQMPTRTKL
jgi:hypothetical protein